MAPSVSSAHGTGPGRLLWWAGMFAVMLLVVYSLTHLTVTGQRTDTALGALASGLPPWWAGQAELVRVAVPLASAGVAGVLLLRAFREGNAVVALGALTVPVVAVLLAELLKVWFIRPSFDAPGHPVNSYPSSNVAAVAGLWVCVWLLVRRRARPWTVAPGIVLVAMSMLASVVTTAHRWSDVVGSVLLVMALGTAIQWWSYRSSQGPENAHARWS